MQFDLTRFFDANQVLDLIDHATHGRGIFQFAGFMHFVQAKALQALALIILATDRASDLGHCDSGLFLVSHILTPSLQQPVQPHHRHDGRRYR